MHLVLRISCSLLPGVAMVCIPPAWAQLGPLPGLPTSSLGQPNGPAQLDSLGRANTLRVEPAAGTASRTLADKLNDTISVLDFGARCDGSTDDSAAIAAASSSGKRVMIPAGLVCNGASVAAPAITATFVGPGQIKTSDGNLRAPIISELSAAPTKIGNLSAGVVAGYNGDLSHVPFAIEQRITGASTLGQPAAGGYQIVPETSAFFEQMYNASGISGSATSGRTGVAQHFMLTTQAGGGDAYNLYLNCFAAGSAATSSLYVPACVGIGGQSVAQGQGAYLNPYEMHLLDNGNDVSAVGTVDTMVRTAADTHGLKNYWEGVLVQNQGTVAIDSGFHLQGPAAIGLDLATSALGANRAAITLASGQRIYGAAVNADPLALSRTTVPGTSWLDYTPAAGWESYAAGNQVFAVGGGANNTVLGGNNTAAGQNSLAAGAYNNLGASAQYSAAIGGANIVAGPSSFVQGLQGSDHGNTGAACQSSGQFATAGDAQGCTYVLRAATSSTSPARLTSDGAIPASTGANCVGIAFGHTYALDITVAAHDTNATAGRVFSIWRLTEAVLTADSTGVGFASFGSPVQQATGAGASAALALAADTTGNCLSVTFTAPNTDAWHAVATVRTAEVE